MEGRTPGEALRAHSGPAAAATTQVASLAHLGVTRGPVARPLRIDLAEPRVGAAEGGEGMADVPHVLHHRVDLRRLGLVPPHQPSSRPRNRAMAGDWPTQTRRRTSLAPARGQITPELPLRLHFVEVCSQPVGRGPM